jgi:hypothetical protein
MEPALTQPNSQQPPHGSSSEPAVPSPYFDTMLIRSQILILLFQLHIDNKMIANRIQDLKIRLIVMKSETSVTSELKLK